MLTEWPKHTLHFFPLPNYYICISLVLETWTMSQISLRAYRCVQLYAWVYIVWREWMSSLHTAVAGIQAGCGWAIQAPAGTGLHPGSNPDTAAQSWSLSWALNTGICSALPLLQCTLVWAMGRARPEGQRKQQCEYFTGCQVQTQAVQVPQNSFSKLP